MPGWLEEGGGQAEQHADQHQAAGKLIITVTSSPRIQLCQSIKIQTGTIGAAPKIQKSENTFIIINYTTWNHYLYEGVWRSNYPN